MVTHDSALCQACPREVHLFDGKVVSGGRAAKSLPRSGSVAMLLWDVRSAPRTMRRARALRYTSPLNVARKCAQTPKELARGIDRLTRNGDGHPTKNGEEICANMTKKNLSCGQFAMSHLAPTTQVARLRVDRGADAGLWHRPPPPPSSPSLQAVLCCARCRSPIRRASLTGRQVGGRGTKWRRRLPASPRRRRRLIRDTHAFLRHGRVHQLHL